MSIADTISGELKENGVCLVESKYSILNKSKIDKYVYLNEDERMNHEIKLKEEGWELLRNSPMGIDEELILYEYSIFFD